jgi:myo-inositol-1(or 4)-monophosphatase
MQDVMDTDTAKRIGIAAAYKGGQILRAHFGKVLKIDKKGPTDLVTEADRQSEKVIIETIRAAFPEHAVLAEESGMSAGARDIRWYIDPLDGTTNFAHGLNLFCVSIACAVDGDIALGIVLGPLTDELFVAVKGQGATRNGRSIRVSNTRSVSESLLVTGFPYDSEKDHFPIIRRFSNCLKVAQGIRRLGSAALDLCYLACGRFAGYWEQNLHPWDTAAGFLIAKESGAEVTDFSNAAFSVDKPELLATNGKIHDEMLMLLKIEDRT